MKITIFEPFGLGNGSNRYYLAIDGDGDGITLEEDGIIELFNVTGALSPKIIQRRADENRENNNRG